MDRKQKDEKKLFFSRTFFALLIILASGVVLSAPDWRFASARAADEDEEKEIKEDIELVNKRLKKEEQQKTALEKELSQIQGSVFSTQREIKKTENNIQETALQISRKEAEIYFLDEKLKVKRNMLKEFLREIYYGRQTTPLEIILSGENFRETLNSVDHFLTLDQKTMGLIFDIKLAKEKILAEKENLVGIKEDHKKLLVLKEDQERDLIANRSDTQRDIIEKAATIRELNSKLSKLRGELSALLGKSYNAKDIEDAASFAAKTTGVRKDFILGMLVVESDLGRFTGGCAAEQSRMSSYRMDLFKGICKELDYNWKKQKVSCPPKSYKGTGGAMGVAQFMSDTWMGYKSQIASVTGHNPPNPWNLTDGVTAMALKLARGGATKKSGECNAAKLYLSGTTSSKYNWYCDRVLYWAKNYEDKLGG